MEGERGGLHPSRDVNYLIESLESSSIWKFFSFVLMILNDLTLASTETRSHVRQIKGQRIIKLGFHSSYKNEKAKPTRSKISLA